MFVNNNNIKRSMKQMHVDRVMSSLGRQQDTTMKTELVLY